MLSLTTFHASVTKKRTNARQTFRFTPFNPLRMRWGLRKNDFIGLTGQATRVGGLVDGASPHGALHHARDVSR